MGNYLVPRGSLQALLSKQLPKYLSSEEVRAVIDNARNPRDRLMVECLWQLGPRISELLSITPSHIDFLAGVIRLPTLKRRGRMVRVIPVKPNLLGELARHIASNKIQDNERLFQIKRVRAFQIIQKACQQAGIDQKRSHPHTIRHSFAIHCVLNHVPVPVLNEWLGHAGLESTIVYTKILAQDSRQFYQALKF